MSHHGRHRRTRRNWCARWRRAPRSWRTARRRAATAEVWQILHDTPGLQDVWQLHFSVAGGKEHNAADSFIANIDEVCEGKWLKMTAMRDGSFTIENARNKHQKTYAQMN